MIRIDRDGLVLGAVLGALATALGATAVVSGNGIFVSMSIIMALAAVYSLYFFRDPERVIPAGEACAVAAADGRVVDVSRIPEDAFPGGEALRIAVFMNVFDVHVNRCPLTGNVTDTTHRPGKKLNAMSPRAALENEFGDTGLVTPFGPVRIRQIAGLVARRVVTRVTTGDMLDRGARIGLIRFGSRVDVFLPVTFELVVTVGDRVRAGETVIARHQTTISEG